MPLGRRAGFALAAALFAVALVSALVAALFFSAAQESRAAVRGALDARAFAAAELGLHGGLAAWDPARNLPAPDGMAVGESRASTIELASGDRARVVTTRVSTGLFLVASAGTARAGTEGEASVRRTGMALRLERRLSTPRAAVTTFGPVTVSPGATVDGSDHVPPGWPACAAGGALAAADAARGDSALSPRPGTPAWARLVAAAITLPRDEAAAAATLTRSRDARSFQLLYAPASLRLDGVSVQGVLAVDGDVELAHGAELTGILIVRGALRSGPGGGRVLGAVVTHDSAGADIGPGLRIEFSSCAVEAALYASARVAPIPDRGWIQIF